ncbi:MAG: DUF1127 domain-containing protein [Thalassovita sp.]|nr:DUF1127 domain-containing protein [Thalassovita sp.]
MLTTINFRANRITACPGNLSFFARLMRANALLRQRAALRRLDDAALDDIGLSRTEALREAQRPIWDAPESWIK